MKLCACMLDDTLWAHSKVHICTSCTSARNEFWRPISNPTALSSNPDYTTGRFFSKDERNSYLGKSEQLHAGIKWELRAGDELSVHVGSPCFRSRVPKRQAMDGFHKHVRQDDNWASIQWRPFGPAGEVGNTRCVEMWKR